MTVPENTYTIILIAGIVILFTLYIVGLIKALRAGSTGRRAAIPALTLAFLLLVYLAFNLREIRPADWAQIVLLFGLVVVTGVYALIVYRQFGEMREQRLSEAQPYLLLRLKDRVVQWNNIEPDKRRPTEFQVIIHNAGKGPAINLCTALWHQYKSRFVCERKGYLVAGEEWEAPISRFTTLIEEKEGWLPKLRDKVEQNKTGIIAVECKDIHKRNWISYLYLEKHVYEDAFVTEGEQNIVELKND